MNPADQYFERAAEYHLVADSESDPDRRELMRELALCWLLQAEKADGILGRPKTSQAP
jgi:hypothetical protein